MYFSILNRMRAVFDPKTELPRSEVLFSKIFVFFLIKISRRWHIIDVIMNIKDDIPFFCIDRKKTISRKSHQRIFQGKENFSRVLNKFHIRVRRAYFDIS